MLGFLVAVAAGYLSDRAEKPLARPLAETLRPWIAVDEAEMRPLSFMLCLLLAGLLAELLHSGTPFWVILGGVLGYFGSRIIAAVQGEMERRKRDD